MMILRVSGQSLHQEGSDPAALRKIGISSELAETGAEALEYLRLYEYDLVLIDLQLTDIPAQEVIRRIRAEGIQTPAVILAGTVPVSVKVRALDQGADDIVVTPCDREELLARLRAVVRRSHGHANSTLRVGPVELSLDRHEVYVFGRRLSLTRREFAMMEFLFLKQGTVLNKAAFLDHLYCGIDEPELKAIDVTLCRVRKKLADAGVPDLIDTVRGRGYIVQRRASNEPALMDRPAEALQVAVC